MKVLTHHTFDAKECRRQWHDFDALMKSKVELSERADILPFFKSAIDLSLLICRYFPLVTKPNRFAHEFSIQGDFVADLVVGDASLNRFVLVEFENGAPSSIFKTVGTKATPSWAPRIEGAYSQLIDWLWKLEDQRSTRAFETTFGDRRATFQGLIVIGKSMNLSDQEKDRLKWRMDRTIIDSNKVSVVSFDELHRDLGGWLTEYFNV